MPFVVKNVLKYTLNFLGNYMVPGATLDLLTLYSVDEIKTMLLGGELYNFIMGRSLTIIDPKKAAEELSLTDSQYAWLSNAGFFKGLLGLENLKDPFQFDSDGYLLVNITDANLNVTATVDTTLLATSANQLTLYSKQSDAYSVEVAMSDKLDLLATAAKQDTLYAKQSDAYSVEVAMNNKLDLLATKANQVDAYSVLSNISTRLPTSLGEKLASQSFPVVLAPDAYVAIKGYDFVTDSVYISPTYVESDLYLEEDAAISTTGLTANTIYYYPSTDGIVMGSYRNLSVHYNLVNGASADAYCEIYFEGSDRATFVAPLVNITRSAGQISTGSLYPSTLHRSTAGNGLTLDDIAIFQELNLQRIRVCVKPWVANSGSIIISFRRST